MAATLLELSVRAARPFDGVATDRRRRVSSIKPGKRICHRAPGRSKGSWHESMNGWHRWMAPLVALIVIVALAGCGGTGGGTTSAKALPCHGSVIGGGATPSVTLRNADTNHETPAPVGAVVEIRMDGQHTWSLDTVTPSDALTPVGAQGALQQSECVWDFRVARAGVVTVSMVGGALCEPNQACPAYAILAKFIIRGV